LNGVEQVGQFSALDFSGVCLGTDGRGLFGSGSFGTVGVLLSGVGVAFGTFGDILPEFVNATGVFRPILPVDEV